MIAHILQENLLKALMRVGRNLSARPQLPILQNVLLVTEGEKLRITTSSLETTETVWVSGKILEEGGLCVPARVFTELVASLPQDTVVLTSDEATLSIQSGGYNATIPGLSKNEFPPLDTKKPKKTAELSGEGFVDDLERVLYAAATDESRPLLSGVRIIKIGEELIVAATDGYRLSVKKIRHKNVPDLNMVVPAKALSEIVRVYKETKEQEALELYQSDDGQLVFLLGDTELRTRIIDGQYPNYEKIIPRSHTTRALFDTGELTKAAKSASIFAKDNANIIRLVINKDGAVLSASAPGAGENKIELSAVVEGEGGEIAFNGRFLLDYLSHTHEDQIVFEMTGSLNPGAFTTPKDDSYLHIIMPVRVQK